MINMPAKKQKIIGRRKINRENVFLFSENIYICFGLNYFLP
jgi:hypothetical protein